MFIYRCGDLSWSDTATIGFNAPITDAFTHPLSTIAGASVYISSDEIACIHEGSVWNNIIIELEDSNHILETTPEPHFSTGIKTLNRTVQTYMPIIPCVYLRKLCGCWFHWVLHSISVHCTTRLLLV